MRKLDNIINYFKIYLAISISVFCFLILLVHIFIHGIASLNLDFVFGIGKPEGASMLPAILNTIIIIILTIMLAVPIGVCSAIYLNEYSKASSKIVSFIRLAIESLAGIPSIIFGLFGFLFFLVFLKWSWSIIAGVFTMSIMILPVVIRSTEEALKDVPNTFREGSYALGAGKVHTIFKIILPSSLPGILVGVLLSIGRIVGESAALILTAGTVMKIPSSIFSSGATLSVFMYTLVNESADIQKAYATAIVLLIIVLILNICVKIMAKKFNRL